MKIILMLMSTSFIFSANAQNFSESCESKWQQEILSHEFTRLLDSADSISLESARELLQQRNLSELEMRLLEKKLAINSTTQSGATELKLLMSLQVPCTQADLTATGVPLKKSDYINNFSNIEKHFSYFEVPRQEEVPSFNHSTDKLSAATSNNWKWVAATAAIVAAIYFQQNFQIEY